MSEYVSLVPGLRAGGEVYERGQPVDDTMPNFGLLTETNQAAHRATPVGKAAADEYEARQGQSSGGQEQQQEEEVDPAYDPNLASDAAKQLASEHGLSLAEIEGTGSGGNTTKGDVERALAERQPDEQEANETDEAGDDPEDTEGG